jgi:hypothetical protein
MKEYFSHSAYIRWYRQYQINLNQIRTQFDALRLPVETIPFPEHTRHLLQAEIDEIDIVVDKLSPRNFSAGAKPLETQEVFVENCKLILNVILGIFRSSFSFESVYEKEKKRILKEYRDSNIKGKLLNFRRHIDEAIYVQMKELTEAAKAQSEQSQPMSESAVG